MEGGSTQYTLEIIKRTGCSGVGVDLTPGFIVDARQQAMDAGLEDKATYLVGDYLNLPDEVKKQTFTHVIVLGCLFYVHDRMAEFLREVTSCTDNTSVLMIQDFDRSDGTTVQEIADVMKHWRVTAPTLTNAEYRGALEEAGFEIKLYRNDTEMAIRSCDWLMEVAASISKETSSPIFTHWVLKAAYLDGRVTYNTIIASKKSLE